MYSLSHVRSTISSIGYLFHIRRDWNAGRMGPYTRRTGRKALGDMERLAVKPYLAVGPKKRLSVPDSRFLGLIRQGAGPECVPCPYFFFFPESGISIRIL